MTYPSGQSWMPPSRPVLLLVSRISSQRIMPRVRGSWDKEGPYIEKGLDARRVLSRLSNTLASVRNTPNRIPCCANATTQTPDLPLRSPVVTPQTKIRGEKDPVSESIRSKLSLIVGSSNVNFEVVVGCAVQDGGCSRSGTPAAANPRKQRHSSPLQALTHRPTFACRSAKGRQKPARLGASNNLNRRGSSIVDNSQQLG